MWWIQNRLSTDVPPRLFVANSVLVLILGSPLVLVATDPIQKFQQQMYVVGNRMAELRIHRTFRPTLTHVSGRSSSRIFQLPLDCES
ncbi:hypothetical protein EV421DRAFT_305397 [Armillaria borealis]|uniref:Uncharacterized protein n=1 Tax=Armillaria borealis TaxID=47425 RepID=A0AA39ITX3_9AGAR|nr:hypothetical protein EV421DRAFT_305397 [Armillaria borealis]